MKLVKLLMLPALPASGAALAQEHPACRNIAYHYEAHISDEPRSMANSCPSTSIANLHYIRVYHPDLVTEATALAGLISYSDNSSNVHFEAYRLYIALHEQMAPIGYPDSAARVALLNREYDRRVEIASLRLRGYDQVADHLESTISNYWQTLKPKQQLTVTSLINMLDCMSVLPAEPV
ncbi:MAG: hypothetical protein JSW45_13330 [Thiotrichales bacterium]|nr:MAG: hypothetical protein JSW45_13330 [Thiotrichales bacterium]